LTLQVEGAIAVYVFFQADEEAGLFGGNTCKAHEFRLFGKSCVWVEGKALSQDFDDDLSDIMSEEITTYKNCRFLSFVLCPPSVATDN
jgi:hypothetical protein